MLQSAILLKESIRHGQPFRIMRRYTNGVIVGEAYHPGERSHVAITVDNLKHTTALHPVVGNFIPLGSSWIFPGEPQPMELKQWLRGLRIRPRLEWLRLMKRCLPDQAYVKVAIEDYSTADLATLGKRGWYVGRSAHAPLWRIYAIIPEPLYERSNELPVFDGTMRSMDRFGAIYDPDRHDIVLK